MYFFYPQTGKKQRHVRECAFLGGVSFFQFVRCVLYWVNITPLRTSEVDVSKRQGAVFGLQFHVIIWILNVQGEELH